MLGVKKTDSNLMFLYAVYLAAIFLSNLTYGQQAIFFGILLPAAGMTYPISLLTLCVICELWRRGEAYKLVFLALSIKFMGIVMLGTSQLFINLPRYGIKNELWWILGASLWRASDMMILRKDIRLWAAALVSFTCAQAGCVWVFHAIYDRHVKRTGSPWGGRWARYLGAAMAGEMIETVVFLTLVLAPDWGRVWSGVKWHVYMRGILTLAGLPVFYLVTWRRRYA